MAIQGTIRDGSEVGHSCEAVLEDLRERREDLAVFILLPALFRLDDRSRRFSSASHLRDPQQQLGASYRKIVGQRVSLGCRN